MNRIKLLLLSVICTLSANAQLNGDGYYRVQNKETQRYISVLDGYGSVNVNTTDADMEALRTVYGFERVVSDPSTVIYIKQISGGYDFQTQGTGSYKIIQYAIKVDDWGDGTYGASAKSHGMHKQLSDAQVSWMWAADDPRRIYGKVTTNRTDEDAISWYVLPMSTTDGYYFGINPDVTVGSSYFKSFYASFPFTFASDGMKAFYVSNIDETNAQVIIKEIEGGVPAATPVIIQCSSTDVASNKLNIGASVSGSASGNKMTGVYFCRPKDDDTSDKHVAVVEYNPSTMRVLGSVNGKLAFIKSNDLKYIPANSTYITVSASAPDILYVFDKEPESVLLGDANNDGEVGIGDIIAIVNIIAGQTTGYNLEAADANQDGDIGIGDIITITNKIAGN